MASFPARRAPNVSQYIANLNVVRPESDHAVALDEGYSFEEDLNMFTNAEFLDYPVDDNGLEQSVLNYSAPEEQRSSPTNAIAKKEYHHGLDLVDGMCVLIIYIWRDPFKDIGCRKAHEGVVPLHDLIPRSSTSCAIAF